MSTIAAEALVLAQELKERLRQIANRYLDQQDKLPVSASEEEIIDVLDEYDEYSYMNAFLNSIEVFPDKDYSINDTEGHIKGLRDYAFYNNTALKSVNLPAVTQMPLNIFVGCSNLEEISTGFSALTYNASSYRDTIFSNFAKLKVFNFPKLTYLNLGQGYYFSLNHLLTTFYAPKLTTLTLGGTPCTFLGSCEVVVNLNLPSLVSLSSSGAHFMANDTGLKSILIKGGTINCSTLELSNKTNLVAFIMVDQNAVATMSKSALATEFTNNPTVVTYAPATLVSSYASATNWSVVNSTTPIQQIESNINYLRETLGVDFSYTPYANKKWENGALVTDSTIGEEVDE